MAQLRRDNEQFVDRGVVVLALGPEGPDEFRSYWEGHSLPFIGLPDPTYSVLKLYGQEIDLFKFGRMPAQVLVDKAGVARFVHYGHDMTDIPSDEEMLGLVDQLDAEATSGDAGDDARA
jgi:peroxiredoxin